MENVNMFTDGRGVVRKECPIKPDAWVEFYDDILMDTALKTQGLGKDSTTQESLAITVAQIKDWNFADEQGRAEITVENLLRLPAKVLTWICKESVEVAQQGEAAFDDQKKALPAS